MDVSGHAQSMKLKNLENSRNPLCNLSFYFILFFYCDFSKSRHLKGLLYFKYNTYSTGKLLEKVYWNRNACRYSYFSSSAVCYLSNQIFLPCSSSLHWFQFGPLGRTVIKNDCLHT